MCQMYILEYSQKVIAIKKNEIFNLQKFLERVRYEMEALSVLAVIGILIFTVINLIIYHKVFTVTYFNLSKGCFTELFLCVDCCHV